MKFYIKIRFQNIFMDLIVVDSYPHLHSFPPFLSLKRRNQYPQWDLIQMEKMYYCYEFSNTIILFIQTTI